MANDGQAEEGSVSGGGRQPAAGGGCPTALPASDPPLSRRSVAAVFAGLLVAMTVGTLNQTIVATVLPTIVGELGGVNRMLWVTTSYVLAATVTMPLYGKMGDLIGRKGLFIGALALFVAGSAACALAPSMEGLVIGRAVQGLGGGGLMVLSQAIVADVVPPRRRALYLSIMGVAYAVPMLAGPLLGGFFADAVGWRWAFWFDVPLALAAIVIAAVFLPKPRRTAERAPFDVGGAVTLVAAVTARWQPCGAATSTRGPRRPSSACWLPPRLRARCSCWRSAAHGNRSWRCRCSRTGTSTSPSSQAPSRCSS